MTVVGSASVRITADVSGLYASIESQLQGLDKLGAKLGEDVGKSVKAGVKEGIGDAEGLFNVPLGKSYAQGVEAGKRFGQGFQAGAKPYFKELAQQLGQTFGKDFAGYVNSNVKENLKVEQIIEKQVKDASEYAAQTLSGGISTGMSKGAKKGGDALVREMDRAGNRGGNALGSSFSQSLDRWLKGRKPAPFELQIVGLAQNIVELQTMQGLLMGVAAAAGSAAGAIGMFAGAAAAAIPAMTAFASAAGAMVQGLMVGVSLFSGVGDAIDAYSDQQKEAAKATDGSAESMNKQEEQALALKSAQDELNDAIIEGARANEDAAERVSDAEEAYSDAVEALDDAEKDLVETMEDEQDALEDLNQARRDAQEDLEDYALAVEGAALSEERAMLDLAEAEEDLAKARASGNVEAIYEADLAYREALHAVEELTEANQDLQEEADAAYAAGVDGSEAVIQAQEDYIEAIEATADAQEGVSDAIEGVDDAMRELTRAIEDVPRVAEDAALRIEQAELGVAQAMNDVTTASQGSAEAINEVNEAFAELSPAAQEFVQYWVDVVEPVFEEIQQAGQEVFFPQFQKSIEMIIEHEQAMRMVEKVYVDTADVLGHFSVALAEAFLVPDTLSDLEAALNNNVVMLQNMLQAAVNLVDPMVEIWAAAIPVSREWTASVVTATEEFAAFIDEMANTPSPKGTGYSQLEQFFIDSMAMLQQFGNIFGNVFDGIVGVIQATMPAIEYFMDSIETMTAVWEASMTQMTPDEIEMINDLLMQMSDNFGSLLSLLSAIGQEFLKLGANENLEPLLDAITELIPALGELANMAFNQVAPALTRIAEAAPPVLEFFQSFKTIEAFANTIALAAEALSGFLGWLQQFPAVEKFIGIATAFFGMYKALNLIAGLGGRLIKYVTDFGSAILKIPSQITGAYDSMKKFFVDADGGWNKLLTSMKDKATSFGDWWERLTGSWGEFFKTLSSGGGFSVAWDAKKQKKADIQFDQDVKNVKTKTDRAEKAQLASIDKQAKELERALKVVGEAGVEGLEEGLLAGFPDLKYASEKMGKIILDTVKKELDITSPSRKMHKIGEETVEGYEDGLEGGTLEVKKQAEKIADSVIREFEKTEEAAEEAAEDTIDKYANKLQTDTSEVTRAADQVTDAATTAMKTGAAEGGADAGEAAIDGYAGKLKTDSQEVTRAADQVTDAAVTAMKTGAAEGGNDAGDLQTEGYEQALDAGRSEVVLAAQRVEDAASDALQSGAYAAGKVAGESEKKGFIEGMDMSDAEAQVVANDLTREVQDALNDPTTLTPHMKVEADVVNEQGEGSTGTGGDNGGAGAGAGYVLGSEINKGEGGSGGSEGGGDTPDVDKPSGGGGSKAAKGLALIFTPAKWIAAGAIIIEVGQTVVNALNADWIAIGEAWSATWRGMFEGLAVVFDQGFSVWWDTIAYPFIQTGFNNIGAWWSQTWRGMFQGLAVVFDEGFSVWWNTMAYPTIQGWFNGIGSWWSQTWRGMFQGVALIFDEGFSVWWDTIAYPWVQTSFNNIGAWWSQTWRGMFTNVATWWDGISAWWDTSVAPGWDSFWNRIGAGWSEMWSGNKDFLFDWWNVDIMPFFEEEAVPDWDATTAQFQDGWNAAWAGMSEDTQAAWDNEFVPWMESLPPEVSEKLKGTWDEIPASLQVAFVSTTEFWDTHVMPYIESLPEQTQEALKNMWGEMPDGFQKFVSEGYNLGAEAMNKYAIKSINSMPFVSPKLDNWSTVPGFAKGGPVGGPRGPIDNVVARLTPGEYVLTRKMVRMLGLGNLERWRRGAGGRGGANDWMAASDSDVASQVAVWQSEKGTAEATRMIFDKTADATSQAFVDSFNHWLQTDAQARKSMDEWGKKIDKKLQDSLSVGGNVPPYTGPPDGWTYPLAIRVTPSTYPDHKQAGAYDFPAPSGTAIFAVTVGKVIISKGITGSYGEHIKISHSGDTSLYAHMSKRIAKVGQTVKTGQKIGLVGSTGNSTGPHLHLEISPPANTVSKLKSHGVKMARGGVVQATPGGVMAVLAEGGQHERVTPLDNHGRSAAEVEMLEVLKGMAADLGNREGGTINVFPAPGMNERELASRVSRRMAFTHRRRS